jgi:hypothetical protein
MMKEKVFPDILFFAEDPGPANYVVHLPAECQNQGFTCKVLAGGTASRSFQEAEVPYEEMMGGHGTPTDIIRRLSPRVVVVGTSENPGSPGFGLLEAAKRSGLATIGVVDAFMNAAYRFRGSGEDPLRFAPDWIAVPDEWTRGAFLDLGCHENRVVVCGHPRYDFVRQRADDLKAQGKEALRRQLFPDVQPKKRVVLFATELSKGLNLPQFLRSGEYTLTGWGTSNLRTQIVLEEFLSALDDSNERPYMALRLHPKEAQRDFAAYLAHFDRISQWEPVLEVIFASDFVVGLTSTILLEASLLGRPTLSILPREAEREWLPTIRAGLTACVTTREELQALLPRFLTGSVSNRVPRLDDVFVFGATKRVVDLIKTVLNTHVATRAGRSMETRGRDGTLSRA